MYVLEAVGEDVGEPNDHGRREVAGLETFDDLEEVDDVGALGIRPHNDVAGVIDGEVTLPPRVHVVEIERILDPPGLGGVVLPVAVDGAFRVCCHVS